MAHQSPSPDLSIDAHPWAPIAVAEQERVLNEARDALAGGVGCVALSGPPGFGKTFVLRRLEVEPPPGARIVVAPSAEFDGDDITHWLLAELGNEGSALAHDDFLQWARVERQLGRRCVVVVDDAHKLSFEAARQLDEWSSRARGGLQIVLAGAEGRDFEAIVKAFGDSATRLELRTPLRGDALHFFADALVARTVGNRGDAPVWLFEIEELCRATAGVPGQIEAEIQRRLGDAAQQQRERAARAQIEAARKIALPTAGWRLGTRRSGAPSTETQGAEEALAPRYVTLGVPYDSRPRSSRWWHWWPAAALVVLALWLAWPGVPGPSVAEEDASPSTVALYVHASSRAEIRVNGEPVGVTPVAGLPVGAGSHELVAVFADGRTVTKHVDLRADTHRIRFP